METFIYPSPLETARGLVLHLLEQMSHDAEEVFHIALSGGSTPALMFDLWAKEYKEVTPWERVKIYWVDERCVPPESADSNYGLAYSLLLGLVPIPARNVFRIRGEAPPLEEAERYSALVEEQLPRQDGYPVFDVVILGAGDDGHTSSIFPGQEDLLSSDKIYVVSHHPVSGQTRIALTGRPILAAKNVIFLITGEKKAKVVEKMYQPELDGPASYVAHQARHVELFLDEEAATGL